MKALLIYRDGRVEWREDLTAADCDPELVIKAAKGGFLHHFDAKVPLALAIPGKVIVFVENDKGSR